MMKNKYWLLIFAIILTQTSLVFSETIDEIEKARVILPNGWGITKIGNSIQLGDLPLNIIISPNKTLAAVTNNGQSDQSIELIDLTKNVVVDSITIPKSWYGLAFSSDNKFLFASGGNDNIIWKYEIKNYKLKLIDSIILGEKYPNKISPTGITVNKNSTVLYVVTKDNNSLYIVDLRTNKITDKIKLDGEGYQCILSPDESKLYISCWGDKKILIFNTQNKEKLKAIHVGDHPNEMCLTKDGKFLFVANSMDNTCSVVDLTKNEVIETLDAAVYPNSPIGSTTNAVALSEDDRRLYIANADNNCLAVWDVSKPGKSTHLGFIPTGWYPTNLKVINKTLYITNGKGFYSKANPKGPNPASEKEKVIYQKGDNTKKEKVEYIGGLFRGTLSIISEPDIKTLADYTKLVYENTPFKKSQMQISDVEANNPIPKKVGESSPIKYIFYVIKENRTYDQVLGDIAKGNGDTNLVLFGEYYTPNLHKLANEYVLLDNFYCDAEVSADGHNWSMGAYANDYLEKTWPTSYGGRGGDYEAEGRRAIANNKQFIWDLCKANNVSYRSYGEFIDNWKANITALEGHFCQYFTGWDMTVQDTTRFYQWQRDFDSLLQANAVPQFNVIRMGNDHTSGLKKGEFTPFACVADNDVAVGMLVDYLSHSPIWKESVVLILEDDAQNGPDHVDAHRSTAYIAGPYVKRNFVDHTPYTTSSFLRTMELILGLPPMTQYDAAATPLWRCFTMDANFSPYKFIKSNIDLNARNTAMNDWQKKSEEFDFSKEDNIIEDEFNRVIWYAVKGNVSYPGVRRSAFVWEHPNEEDDD